MAVDTQGVPGSSETGAKKAHFDPDKLAYYEVTGWREYYARNWLRFLRLMLQMEREQFGFSWPRAVQGAYYVIAASMAWAPLDHDVRKVRRYLRKFYRLVREHGKHFTFYPRRVAELELKYWYLNRKLGDAPMEERGELIGTLAELHAATFGLTVEDAMPSAIGRAQSLCTVGLITHHDSHDEEADWRKAEAELRAGYRSLVSHL